MLYVCDTCVGDIPDDFKGHCLEETRENEILEIQAMEKRIEQREEYNKMLENDIEVEVQELERCDSRCTKLYNENCQLVRKMKTLEEHEEVLRVTIQYMEKLLTIKDSNADNKIDNTKINVLIQTEGLGRPTTAEWMTQTESESKGKTYYESMFKRILDEKLSSVQTRLDESLTAKLEENIQNIEIKLDNFIEDNKSYALAVKNRSTPASSPVEYLN